MPEEDQERFEDYLELERWIDELTPTQVRVYWMAALLRFASPEATAPRPAFAAELQARLEQELRQSQERRRVPVLIPAIANAPTAEVPIPATPTTTSTIAPMQVRVPSTPTRVLVV